MIRRLRDKPQTRSVVPIARHVTDSVDGVGNGNAWGIDCVNVEEKKRRETWGLGRSKRLTFSLFKDKNNGRKVSLILFFVCLGTTSSVESTLFES